MVFRMNIFNFIKWRIIDIKFKKKWRIKNANNSCELKGYIPLENINIGQLSYGDINVTWIDNQSKISIGSCCSIAPNVHFLSGAEHNITTLSSYPFRVRVLNDVKFEAKSKGDIVVDDDVWIGYGAVILSGVHIGQGAVIGAGAVVTKDVAPYTIVGGVPAKIIKKRFSDPVINYLLTLDYSKLNNELILNYIDTLYDDIEGMDLELVKKRFEWFPKKI